MTVPPNFATPPPPPRWLVLTAYATIYLVWGSTYLGIRVAIETMPPLTMAGSRFFLAGVVFFAWRRWRGDAWPTRREWGSATLLGVLLLLVGNGGVTWAEQRVPSSIAALMVALVPLWMVLADWLRPAGQRPRLAVCAGLLVGFGGVALLVGSRNDAGGALVDPAGAAVLLLATVGWSIGSLASRHLPQARPVWTAIAAEMIAGGAVMAAAGVARGELAGFTLAQVSVRSWTAFAYLVWVGSLAGFTAYAWLLQVSTPARVATYAYVNPFIAMCLGLFIAQEQLPGTVLVSGALIVGAVGLIVSAKQEREI